jgi:hypothetical protein
MFAAQEGVKKAQNGISQRLYKDASKEPEQS